MRNEGAADGIEEGGWKVPYSVLRGRWPWVRFAVFHFVQYIESVRYLDWPCEMEGTATKVDGRLVVRLEI